MSISPARARASRALLAVVLAVALAPIATAGQKHKAVDWGVYAELAGTTWTAPGGFPRKAWRWSSDGSSILEIEQRKPGVANRVTTIKGAQKGGKLVAVGPDGQRSKGTVESDGSVIWSTEGLDQRTTRTAVQGGVLVEQGVKLKDGRPKKVTEETRFARSNDQSWADIAGGKGKGKGAGGYLPAPAQNTPPSNVVVPPVAPPVANAPVPAAGGNDSLDCMMQSAAVRAAGCKPPSANTSTAPSGGGAGAANAGAQVLMVDGQRMDVSRSFPPNILGTYLYEKRGEPIIELRGDGTGRFQAHMIAPIAIRWWLKSGPTGVPEKITGRNGNYRYTVVLQYVNSTNGNYPSGSYASWYLDTDVAAGCSIILGERFKCR